MKYIFCVYDVWGNEDDFEVNNVGKFTGNPIEVSEDASANDILNACADKGFLKKELLGDIDVDCSAFPDYYEFWDLKTNLPFARVELEVQDSLEG